MKYQTKTGVTLLELLFVIGIIGILASLYLGAVHKARAYAMDKTWRLEAYNYCDYIQDHLAHFYQSQTNYPTLSAAELRERGVFDDRIMDFLSCRHVQFIPFSVGDGDDKIILRIDNDWISGKQPAPDRVNDLVLMKKHVTKPLEPNGNT